MSILNTVYLSAHYPHTNDLNFNKKFRVEGTTPVIFDLQNIENNPGNNLTISKIYFDYGDGSIEYIDSSLNTATSVLEPPSSVVHKYDSTKSLLDGMLSGSVTFFYRNGLKTSFNLEIFHTFDNLIETQPRIVTSSLFAKNLFTFNVVTLTDNKGNLHNKIISDTNFSFKVKLPGTGITLEDGTTVDGLEENPEDDSYLTNNTVLVDSDNIPVILDDGEFIEIVE